MAAVTRRRGNPHPLFPMFAQIQTVDAFHLRDMLVTVGFLISCVAGISAVATLVMNGRRTQKREVTFSEQYMPRDEFSHREKGTMAEIQHVKDSVEKEETNRREDVQMIFAKVNELNGHVAALLLAVQTQTARISVLETDIKTLLGKR